MSVQHRVSYTPTAAHLMLTSWQRLIGHLPALLLWGLLCGTALVVWTAHDDIGRVPRGLTRSLLASHLVPSSQVPSSPEESQSSQAIPSDGSGDDSSNDNLSANGQMDEAQPDAILLLPPFTYQSPLQFSIFVPRSILVLPSDPPPRMTLLSLA